VEEAVKRCPHCRKDKPEGIFHGKKWCPECLAWSRAYLKAYRTNPEVRAASRAYDKARYSEPEKGEAKKAYQKARRANPEKKEAIKVYMNAYRSDPEKKEAMKTRKKVYDSDPEVKEARKNFMKTYNHAYLKTPAGKLSAFNARCKRRDSIGFTTLAAHHRDQRSSNANMSFRSAVEESLGFTTSFLLVRSVTIRNTTATGSPGSGPNRSTVQFVKRRSRLT
jgi:hypothetical protein